MADLSTNVDKLIKYAELDSTEWGEMCMIMAQLSHYTSHMGEDLHHSLRLEVSQQLLWAEQNLDIVEEQVTATHTHKKLEFKE